jgi:hypothetical protein
MRISAGSWKTTATPSAVKRTSSSQTTRSRDHVCEGGQRLLGVQRDPVAERPCPVRMDLDHPPRASARSAACL